jgi:hypothetical protein
MLVGTASAAGQQLSLWHHCTLLHREEQLQCKPVHGLQLQRLAEWLAS